MTAGVIRTIEIGMIATVVLQIGIKWTTQLTVTTKTPTTQAVLWLVGVGLSRPNPENEVVPVLEMSLPE